MKAYFMIDTTGVIHMLHMYDIARFDRTRNNKVE